MEPTVYYINLDRSQDRLENMLKQEKKTKLVFKRITAIDGKELSHQDKKEQCTAFARYFCTPSIIGCFLSHRKAWQEIAKSGAPGVVLEDDCVLRKDFSERVREILDEINVKEPDWDFIYFGSFSLGMAHIFKDVKTKLRYKSKTYHVPKQPLGFHCYMISPNGANKMINVFKKVEYHVDLVFLLRNANFNVYASKQKLGYQPTNCNNSTLNENKFPTLINSTLDAKKIGHDGISLSYHLSAPLIRIPGANMNLNLYIIFMVIMLLSSKVLKPYVFSYLFYEFIVSKSGDREFILKWYTVLLSFA